jgi:hypothetical protein
MVHTTVMTHATSRTFFRKVFLVLLLLRTRRIQLQHNCNKTAISNSKVIYNTRVLVKKILVWEPYVSSVRRWNHTATALAASWMPLLAAASVPTAGPSNIGSREMVGSRLRKHVSTYSATCSTKTRPSASSWPQTTSSSFSIFAPCRVKQRESSAYLLYWFPRAEWAEAKGHQCGFGMAQKVPDFLRFDSPSRLQRLYSFLCGCQLLG